MNTVSFLIATKSAFRITIASVAVLLIISFQSMAFATCLRSPLPINDLPSITVQNETELFKAIQKANQTGNRQILLRQGEYEIKRPLVIKGDNITIRGLTGTRDDVVLRGRGMDGRPSHVFVISGNRITLANLTAGWVSAHVVQVRGELAVNDFRIHNVRLVDAGQQLFKVSYKHSTPDKFSSRGIIEWSSFEFTQGHTFQGYSGGISAIATRNWIVRDNNFSDITGPDDNQMTGPAVLFWQYGGNVLVERNIITNSDRGVQIGLGPKPGQGGGIVRNNMISTVRDAAIGIENATGVQVINNTIHSLNYPNSIEYRFADTKDTRIVNNLVNGNIQSRDGGQGSLEANLRYVGDQWFVNSANGDLRLTSGPENLVDSGIPVQGVDFDVECESRKHGGAPDIGADEVTSGAVPGLLFEQAQGGSLIESSSENIKTVGSKLAQYLLNPDYLRFYLALIVIQGGTVLLLLGLVIYYRRSAKH